MELNCIQKKVDVLVLGAGIAGLEAAYAASRNDLKVAILSKGASASPSVLGFNANISEDDSSELFAEDIHEGSWGLCNKELANALVKGSVQAVMRMEKIGLEFDREDDSQKYHLLQPLGCTVPRLVHSENVTGKRSMALLQKELSKAGVTLWDNMMAVSLIKDDKRIAGVVAFDLKEESVWIITAKAAVITTGGGHLMKGSTYPACMTGDGYAMAYRAGAKLVDMEFIQHEPCRAVYPEPLGISTTLLAKGGVIRNKNGSRFVLSQYPGEYAVPKDALSRLVALEILEGRGTEHGGVYLDLTGLPEDEIRINHTLYDQRFKRVGIDLMKDIVEVGPAAHSIMGGIVIDSKAQTDVLGLYAAGEVTGGIHGANRIGGNAGTETYVFGSLAGENAAKYALASAFSSKAESISETFVEEMKSRIQKDVETSESIINYKLQIQEHMAHGMGPVREGQTLKTMITTIEDISDKVDAIKVASFSRFVSWLELNNMLLVSKIACRAALAREESRGVHYRRDFPAIDNDKWMRNIYFSEEEGMKTRDVQ